MHLLIVLRETYFCGSKSPSDVFSVSVNKSTWPVFCHPLVPGGRGGREGKGAFCGTSFLMLRFGSVRMLLGVFCNRFLEHCAVRGYRGCKYLF